VVLPPSPCLSPGWGALLPSSVQENKSFLPLLPFSCVENGDEEEVSALWRPWETGKTEEKKKTAGKDLNINSSECPPTAPLPSPFSTPVKPTLSPFLPSLPQRRVLRRAKNRRRSPGDLVKRRQRHISYQFCQSPSTPSYPEPEQSTLESASWGGFPGNMDWTTSTPAPRRLDSGNRNSWMFSSGTPVGVPTPSPSPCSTPPWLSDNMEPPSSAYCDGCKMWGNLLSVTVRQARPP
jgi:hypothetical protein